MNLLLKRQHLFHAMTEAESNLWGAQNHFTSGRIKIWYLTRTREATLFLRHSGPNSSNMATLQPQEACWRAERWPDCLHRSVSSGLKEWQRTESKKK